MRHVVLFQTVSSYFRFYNAAERHVFAGNAVGLSAKSSKKVFQNKQLGQKGFPLNR